MSLLRILGEDIRLRAELDELTSGVIERGLASWGGSQGGKSGALILRGQSQLLEDVNALEDLERSREDLEPQIAPPRLKNVHVRLEAECQRGYRI